MALYRCTTVKQGVEAPYLNLSWRNVYTVEASSYDAALAVADLIAVQEMIFHSDKITCTRVTAHLVTEPPRRTGAQLGVTRPGEYAGVGDPWPLWNVVRVDFFDAGVGRPERKFYRVGLHDGMVTADLEILGTYVSPTLNSGLGGIIGLTNYVGPSGEAHDTFAIHPTVAMRQIGWHRRRRPGFVRGYVPV